MSKFRKKPVVIEATQFDPTVKPWPEGVIAWADRPDLPQPRDMSWGFVEQLRAAIAKARGE